MFSMSTIMTTGPRPSFQAFHSNVEPTHGFLNLREIPHFLNHKRVAVRKMSGGLSHRESGELQPPTDRVWHSGRVGPSPRVSEAPSLSLLISTAFRYSIAQHSNGGGLGHRPRAAAAAAAAAGCSPRPLSLASAATRARVRLRRLFVAAGDGICIRYRLAGFCKRLHAAD